jgi:hypothetical protein
VAAKPIERYRIEGLDENLKLVTREVTRLAPERFSLWSRLLHRWFRCRKGMHWPIDGRCAWCFRPAAEWLHVGEQ